MAELLRDFVQRTVPPMSYMIGNGILPVASKMILGGAPKTNKSYLALNMALDLARGRNIFGALYRNGQPVMPVAKPYRVLYMEQEIGENGLQERLRGKDADHPGIISGEDVSELAFYIRNRDTAFRADNEDGRKAIYDEIESVPGGVDVVFLDPMSKFHLADENSAMEMGAICRVADHIIEKFGASVVWIHHTGKEPTQADAIHRRGGDRLRGSSTLFADVDSLVLVNRRSPESAIEPVLELDFELRRGEPIRSMLVRRLRDGKVRYDPDLVLGSKRDRYSDL